MLIILVVCALSPAPRYAVAADLDAPKGPTHAAVDSFLSHHPSAGLVVLQLWTGVDVRHSQKDQGLSGRMRTLTHFQILNRKGLDIGARVVIHDEPRFRTRKLDIEIIRGDKVTQLRKDDLVWTTMTTRSDGIVVLDGEVSQAMVPGVRVGDQVRVLEELEITGVHGLPVIDLGRFGLPTLASAYSLKVPSSYSVTWAYADSTANPDRYVRYRNVEKSGSAMRQWSYREAGATDTDTSLESPSMFRVVPHILDTFSRDEPCMSAGGSWAEVGRAYLRRIDGVFEANREIQALADSLTAGVDDPHEKIDRIYAEVQRRCRYLGLYRGMDGIIPASAKRVLDSGHGDCKGLSTLLISLIRACGIDAHPVLVRTGSVDGLAAGIPNITQFNHFIAWADVGPDGIFLDGTVDHCPAGLVPPSDASSPVLLLTERAVDLVEIPRTAYDPGAITLRVEGAVSADSELTLTYHYRFTGNQAVRMRGLREEYQDDDMLRVLGTAAITNGFNLDIEQVEWISHDEASGDLNLELSVSSQSRLPQTDDDLFLPKKLGGCLVDHGNCFGAGANDDPSRFPVIAEHWRLSVPDHLAFTSTDAFVVMEQSYRYECSSKLEGNVFSLDRRRLYWSEHDPVIEATDLAPLLEESDRHESGYFRLSRQRSGESSP